MKNIILCDLDGTLADIRHRHHFIEKKICPNCLGLELIGKCKTCNGKGYVGKPNWHAFYLGCVDDAPMQSTIDAVDMLLSGNLRNELWIVSARSDEVRPETEAWLKKNLVWYDKLIMRKSDDYTPDDELKKLWLNNGTIPKERVFCVFDDRPKVLRMWQSEGIFTLAVGDLKEF